MSPRAFVARWSVLLALAAASPLSAQGTGRIIGRVVDAEQGAPVAGAQVEVVDAPTLGLVVLEAMASGLPVIAAPAGGVQDHLRDAVNGLTYEAGDPAAMARAMVLLAGEYELTRRLARAARRTAESLSWERELDRLDTSYREICERGVAGPARGAPAREVCPA